MVWQNRVWLGIVLGRYVFRDACMGEGGRFGRYIRIKSFCRAAAAAFFGYSLQLASLEKIDGRGKGDPGIAACSSLRI